MVTGDDKPIRALRRQNESIQQEEIRCVTQCGCDRSVWI